MSDTPETERLRWQLIDRYGTGTFEEVLPKLAAMESQRNDAREQLASEKSTRNAIIAKGIEMEHQLAEAREENEKLREALEKSKEFVQSWGELIDTQYPLWNECMTTIQKALTP